MPLRNTSLRYGSVAKTLHWLIFLLLISQVTFGYFLESIPKSMQAFSYNLHKLTGLLIFALMVLRGLWALINPKPLLPLSTRLWEHLLERLVHFLLYFAILAMALLGWVGSVAGGRPPHLGNFIFNLPITPSKSLASLAFELHNAFAILIITLVSLHVIAAFFHYFIRKDKVLQSMLPGG